MSPAKKKKASKRKVGSKRALRRKAAKKRTARRATQRSAGGSKRALDQTRVVVAAGISPKTCDYVVTAVDEDGGFGRLTNFVLRELGAPDSIVPRPMKNDVAVVSHGRHRIVFVVPDTTSDNGYDLYRQLARAFEKSATLDSTCWIPLLAHWERGGLKPRFSAMAAGAFLEHVRFSSAVISLPGDLSARARAEVVRTLGGGGSSLLLTESLNLFTPAPDLEILPFLFRLALTRKLEPDHLLRPDLDSVLEAVRSLEFLDDEGRPDLALAWEQLPSKVAPNPLWCAWMEETLGSELGKLKATLRGDLS